jgi:hypothetical protein
LEWSGTEYTITEATAGLLYQPQMMIMMMMMMMRMRRRRRRRRRSVEQSVK